MKLKVRKANDYKYREIVDIDEMGDLYNLALDYTEQDPDNDRLYDGDAVFEVIVSFDRTPDEDGCEGSITIYDDYVE